MRRVIVVGVVGLWLVAGSDVVSAIQLLLLGAGPATITAQATAWGSITGTLSSQTDLQAALNAKGTSNFSGAYNDLTGKPTLFDGVYASLTGLPTLFDGTWASLSGKPSTFTPSSHGHVIADVTSLQTTLDNKSAAIHVHAISDVTNLTSSLAGKSDTSHTHAYEPANANIQAHVLSAHAPSNAQANADITKAEIEAKLTGVISSHSHSGGSGPTLLRVSANVANSTTSFADVTGLTLAVTSGVTYRFDCDLSYTTAATTTALQLSVNGPTMTALDYEVLTSTTATAMHSAAQTAVETNTNPATGGAAVRLPVKLTGSFIPSANGTFAVRLRSEIAASAVTVMRGGWCAVY